MKRSNLGKISFSPKRLLNFTFESIEEKYSNSTYSYVIGKIKLSNLLRLKEILPKLDIFIAELED